MKVASTHITISVGNASRNGYPLVSSVTVLAGSHGQLFSSVIFRAKSTSIQILGDFAAMFDCQKIARDELRTVMNHGWVMVTSSLAQFSFCSTHSDPQIAARWHGSRPGRVKCFLCAPTWYLATSNLAFSAQFHRSWLASFARKSRKIDPLIRSVFFQSHGMCEICSLCNFKYPLVL